MTEQELVRRDNLQKIREAGIDPYPPDAFEVTTCAADIKAQYHDVDQPDFEEGASTQNISIAGRLMGTRVMGKAAFAELQDSSGRIQLYVQRDDIGEALYNNVFKKLLDIGDFIGVKGFVFRTKMGEITVHVKELTVLGKSLRPLPIVKKDAEGNVYDAFVDPELRHRMRYVDLVVNEGVKERFILRTKMVNSMRNFLNERGAIEVDTPVLQTIPGGALARPFTTHHNALDIPMYMRIANELYLKRLIVGGFDWVYEFSRNFRNEGIDRTHNPEFTILEFYVAYQDYFWMMQTTEEMLERVALDLHGTTDIPFGEKTISFKAPFQRIGILDLIKEHTGFDLHDMDEDGIREVCKKLHIEVDASMGKGKLIDEIFSEKCEHHIVQPTFIMDHPVEMSPLTKRHRSKPGLVERFELFVNGKEICNAYSELNDPIEQRERFEEQVKLLERGDDEAMFIDHDFLRALEFGMPPTAGIGIGIDRLAMLMTNQTTIQEVLFFPQMRPEQNV